MVYEYIIAVVVFYILAGIKIVNQYERGVKFTLGKYTRMIQPGLRIVLPVIQSWERIDIRVKAVDVPDQDCITKDNISVNVNAIIYYKVAQADKAFIEVENYRFAVSQMAQTTMRNMVGEVDLDELLQNRDEVSSRIQQIIDKATDPWELKLIVLI